MAVSETKKKQLLGLEEEVTGAELAFDKRCSRAERRRFRYAELRKSISRNRYLLLMLIPGIVLLIIFKYIPMYGILMAFQKYRPSKGVFGSEWVGLYQFKVFFEDPYGMRALRNTLIVGLESLAISFPLPILLALSLNEIRNNRFKKVAQTISYMPYFISVVVIVGILMDFCAINGGKINEIIMRFGGEAVDFFSNPKWFRTLYIGSGVWQTMGYNSIIYMAAIAGINPELYEAAEIDGASRLRQTLHITLPSLLPTITILFIMAVGGVLGSDYQKILLMYNANNYETADVLSTYLFRYGVEGGNFSYSTAVGLFNSVLSFLLLWSANRLSKKANGESLW